MTGVKKGTRKALPRQPAPATLAAMQIVDQLCEGTGRGVNEDAVGWSGTAEAGAAWVIDGATGRVEKAELRIRLGRVDATLTTTYKPDEKLKMWVPVEMHERYAQTAGPRPEVITVDSAYTNYQRFDSTVIIK